MFLLKVVQYALLAQLMYGSAFASAEITPITLPSREELIQSQLNVRDKCVDTRCVEGIYKAVYDQIPAQIKNSVRSGYQKPVQRAKFRDVLDAIVAVDARRWRFNQYNPGSMREVAIRKNGDFIDATGSYSTYRGELAGWVIGRFNKAGSLICLQYHDQPYCSPSYVAINRREPALADEEIAKSRVDAGEARRKEEMDDMYMACMTKGRLFEDCESYRYKK